MGILTPILFILSSFNLGSFFFSIKTDKKYIFFLLIVSLISIFIPVSYSTKLILCLFALIILFGRNSLHLLVSFLSGFILFYLVTLCYFYLLNLFSFESLLNSDISWVILFLGCNFTATISKFFLNKEKKAIPIFKSTKRTIYFVFLFEIFLLFFIYFLFTRMYSLNFAKLVDNHPLFLIGLFLLISIMICVLMYNLHQFKVRNEIARQTNEQQILLKTYVDEIKSQKHDFNSHLSTLQYLTYSKQYDELVKYLSTLLEDYDAINQTMITSIPELSAILFKYEKKSKILNVQFFLELKTAIETFPISLYDLNRLLGNLLSNAIEAAQYSEKRTVHFTIQKEANFVVFVVKNSGIIDDEIKKSMFLLNQTTKKEKNNHGYGLHIVNEIVKNARGQINFVVDSTNTICTVRLPL